MVRLVPVGRKTMNERKYRQTGPTTHPDKNQGDFVQAPTHDVGIPITAQSRHLARLDSEMAEARDAERLQHDVPTDLDVIRGDASVIPQLTELMQSQASEGMKKIESQRSEMKDKILLALAQKLGLAPKGPALGYQGQASASEEQQAQDAIIAKAGGSATKINEMATQRALQTAAIAPGESETKNIQTSADAGPAAPAAQSENTDKGSALQTPAPPSSMAAAAADPSQPGNNWTYGKKTPAPPILDEKLGVTDAVRKEAETKAELQRKFDAEREMREGIVNKFPVAGVDERIPSGAPLRGETGKKRPRPYPSEEYHEADSREDFLGDFFKDVKKKVGKWEESWSMESEDRPLKTKFTGQDANVVGARTPKPEI